MLTMALIAQPYSQDACGIGYGAFSALGWAESRFGIDFVVVFSSIVIVSIIIVSLDVPLPLSLHCHIYHCANACLIVPFSHSGWLSLSSCCRHHRYHHHDRHRRLLHRRLVVAVLSLPSS
jgi:hypothetical protein